MRDRGGFFGDPKFWLLLILALTALVYAPGLNGPFVFDDTPNLRPLHDWLSGITGWQEALFGNRSGMFGRPLSMLSFILNAELFGLAPFSFKVTNLLIHLVCGGLIYALLRRLLSRDPQLGQRGTQAALTLSAIWLLHPLQVSTVLYIVQRMAQLSTLFILLALLAYVHGREALEQGRSRVGSAWLFLAVPTATALGLLCKENGALAPLLCAVLELGYFRSSAQAPRPRIVKAFFCLGLILPMLAAIFWYTWPPSRLLAGYSVRTFTLGERLLSEPRALFDYIGCLLLPRGPTLGVYTDDFPVSHGLLHPVTTLPALLGLLALAAIATGARRNSPAIFTGIAFFLAGHAMESTAFPLELYFEHRNYLPSVGIFLALAGSVVWIAGRLPAPASDSPRPQLWRLGIWALCAMLAAATAARSWVWQSWTVMVKQAVRQHPDSTRAQLDNLSLVWNTGSMEETRQLLDKLIHSSNPVTRQLALMASLKQQCVADHAIEPATLAQVRALAGIKLQLADMQTLEALGGYLRESDCSGLSKIDLADTMREIVDAAPQPQSNTAVWRVRFMAADLYARGGQPDEAQRQAELTWSTGVADPAVGVLLAYLQIFNSDFVGARRTLAQLRARIAHWDRRGQNALLDIQQRLPQ
ncbi:hypothetical protein ASG87_07870 [Frateuria sp. Soil773]|nr:hypothetical protein ASG87_07870 [Frateuria sp. Soil773]